MEAVLNELVSVEDLLVRPGPEGGSVVTGVPCDSGVSSQGGFPEQTSDWGALAQPLPLIEAQ